MDIQGKITLDDGETAEFRIGPDGSIFRWGNTDRVLGQTVDVTEAMRDAMNTRLIIGMDEQGNDIYEGDGEAK